MRGIDLAGQRFGRLSVLSRGPSRGRGVVWNCRCDCGNHSSVESGNLRSGGTTSCGCLGLEKRIKARTKHGRSKDALYWRYQNMIARCHSPTHEAYANYGGRGIAVCERWRSSFSNFVADMGDPGPGMTIERDDNDGNYTPENCRWATRLEQMNNFSRNKPITYAGRTQNISEWAREIGLSACALNKRLSLWTTERALTTPPKTNMARRASRPSARPI